MGRYISNIRTMNTVSSFGCVENVVVGVAIRQVSSLLHAHVHSWRWASSGAGANREAASGFKRG